MAEQEKLPLYKSRDSVRALKVASARRTSEEWSTPWELSFQEEGYAPVDVSHEFMQAYQPQPGGYYVTKEGFSPAYMKPEDFDTKYVKV